MQIYSMNHFYFLQNLAQSDNFIELNLYFFQYLYVPMILLIYTFYIFYRVLCIFFSHLSILDLLVFSIIINYTHTFTNYMISVLFNSCFKAFILILYFFIPILISYAIFCKFLVCFFHELF